MQWGEGFTASEFNSELEDLCRRRGKKPPSPIELGKRLAKLGARSVGKERVYALAA